MSWTASDTLERVAEGMVGVKDASTNIAPNTVSRNKRLKKHKRREQLLVHHLDGCDYLERPIEDIAGRGLMCIPEFGLFACYLIGLSVYS